MTGDEQRHPVVAHDDRGLTETQPMDDVKIGPVDGKDAEPSESLPRHFTFGKQKDNKKDSDRRYPRSQKW